MERSLRNNKLVLPPFVVHCIKVLERETQMKTKTGENKSKPNETYIIQPNAELQHSSRKFVKRPNNDAHLPYIIVYYIYILMPCCICCICI